MNQFSILSSLAINSGATDAQTAYIASPVYQDRTDFKGAPGLTDMLNIQLYLLSRVALDNRLAIAMREHLSRGVVNLHFFGISNPTPFFELAVDSPELQQLQDSFEANLGGPLVCAEVRVLKWRDNWKIQSKQSRRINSILDALRASLDWSDLANRHTNPARAEAASIANCAILDEKSSRLWSQRQARLAKLAQATALGVTSWTELLTDVSANVLQPVT